MDNKDKKEKSANELLKEKILMNPENAGLTMSEADITKAFEFCEGYKKFLDAAKTEREAVCYTLDMLKKKGFEEFDYNKKYMPGDKIYVNNQGHALLFGVIGTRPLLDGIKIVASHIDSPRIDLKPRPLYEEAQLSMFKTHYYGGIRKYQWVATPLALHGIVMKHDGTGVEVCIGEDPSDPVLCISDLLPHLSQEQNKRTLAEGIKGEELNLIIGSMPLRGDDKLVEKVKLNIMKILHEKYGIIESDFLSADLCVVPAHKAQDVGLDRSMIGSYGHDDRVCAYTSILGCLEDMNPAYTWINVLADKEEVGSSGNTGLQSRFIEYFVENLAKPHGVEGRNVLEKSACLSADVAVAFDPTFADVLDKRNCAYLNYGVCVTKYTGSRGKSGTNEATAEFMNKIRTILNDAKVGWQIGLLGRVDLGGGGTVAQYISKLGVNTVDIGVPVLSMHSPFELVAKTDVYNAYLAFQAFVKDNK